MTILEALRKSLPPGRIVNDAESMAPMLTDWRGRFHGKAQLAVFPHNAAEVVATVKACIETRTPIVPQGGNTGMAGSATPDNGGKAVILNLAAMNKIIGLNKDNSSITLEAGCTLKAAQDAAANAGFSYPLSLTPNAQCQIGGTVASNAGGLNVVHYGMMRENVLGLEVVTGTGEIWNGLRELRKDNAGYDLKQFFIGCEGTLGIITKASIKLHPKPHSYETYLIGLSSVAEAIALYSKARAEFPHHIFAFEIMSGDTVDIVLKQFPECKNPLPRAAQYILLELGIMKGDAAPNAAFFASYPSLFKAADEKARAGIWEIRKLIPTAEKNFAPTIKHDISLPLDRIDHFLKTNPPKILRQFPGAQMIVMGHLGDGNLHYNVAFPGGTAEAMLNAEKTVNAIVYQDLAALNGSLAAEHGIGLLRKESLALYKDGATLALMRTVKQSLDPHNILNPGKIFDPL